jgi:hypothetical protein
VSGRLGWAVRSPWLVVAVVAVFNALAWYGYSQVSRRDGFDWHLVVIAIFVVAGLVLFMIGELMVRQRRLVLLVQAVLMLSAITCLFSTVYYLTGKHDNWTLPLNHADAIYVALGTLTAVGSAGIAPRTGAMRELLSLQMGVDVLVVIGIFGLVIAQIAAGLSRQ